MRLCRWLVASVGSFLAFTSPNLPIAEGISVIPGETQVLVAKYGSVRARLLNRRGKPLRGVTVYLVHPKGGRSSPRYTGADGRFEFGYVPLQSSPYYLEVYWGRRIIYRKRLTVRGHMRLGDITP